MTDAVGMVAATAALTQALFGDAGGGVASRLQAAFVRELGQARAERAFAAPVGAASDAHDPRRADGAGLVERRTVSLDVRDVELVNHRRTLLERDRDDDGRRGGDGREGDAGTDDADDAAVNGRAPISVGVAEHELAALERALEAVQSAAGEAREVGALQALALSGRVLDDAPDAPPGGFGCALLVLCLAFDGELAAERRVWGFGYTEDRLMLTLDARWDTNGPASAPMDEDGWSVAIDAARDGRAPARTVHRGRSHDGLALAVPANGSPVTACAFHALRIVPA